MPTYPIWREIQMKQESLFLSVAANHFSEMRLMAEGAIALYENQATVLCRMARDADNHEAQIAFNDIGAALYDLRSHMEELQEALHQAVLLDAPEGEEKTCAFTDTFQEPENC